MLKGLKVNNPIRQASTTVTLTEAKRKVHWPPLWVLPAFGATLALLLASVWAPEAAVPAVSEHSRPQPAAVVAVRSFEPRASIATDLDPWKARAGQNFPIDLAGELRSGQLSLEALMTRAAEQAAFRDQLRQRFLLDNDPEMRTILLQLLATAPADEQLAFADRLLHAADAHQRADGYRLLTALPLDNDSARERVLRHLQHETDPGALQALVSGLQPGLLAAEDVEPIATQLLDLSRHQDPRLRASVLPQLSRWTPSEQLETLYFDALSDPDSGVRAAAAAGIGVSQLRSPKLLNALFELAADLNQDAAPRHEALQALLGFPLSRSEVELYRLLQAEVPLHPDHGG